MYILRFVVAARLADPSGFRTWHTLAGMGSWICVCVAIYVLNGISDISGDRHNHSTRPIASGRLGIEATWHTIGWLMVIGATLAMLVSVGMVTVFLLMFGVGWAYSFGTRPLKCGLPGLTVSGTALGVLTYLAGWLSTRGGTPGVDFIVLGIGMSLWMGVVGSATKDLKDVPGDRSAGRRTLPILLGTRPAKLVAGAASITYGVLFLLVVRSVAPGMTLPAWCVLVGGIGVAVAAWCSTRTAGGREAYHAYMVTQYAANLTALA
jgi:4-hydroxybenzoate polyprenyltransferase